MTTAPSLPLDSLRDAAAELRRPFETNAVKWKVQTQFGPKDQKPSGGIIVAYMDRGLVIDRLNMVIPHLWTASFEPQERNHMLCRLTVACAVPQITPEATLQIIGPESITREDVGEGGTLKARYSDALKRVAVHFGVGVSLSRVPRSRMYVNDRDSGQPSGVLRAYPKAKGGYGLEIESGGLAYLRRRYDDWLEQVGKKAFGEPLSHGDLGDAQGDEDVLEDAEAIIDDSSAVDLYVSLSEVGLLPRQQAGLLNQVGAEIKGTAKAEEIEAAVGTLTGEQAAELEKLIGERMDANDREKARLRGRFEEPHG